MTTPVEALEQQLPPKDPLAGAKTFDPVRQALINGYVSLAKGLLTVLVTIALTPFLLTHLGPAGFGIWSLLGLFVTYIQLVDMGTSGAIAKYIGELSPSTQAGQINRLFTSFMILIGIFSCAAIGIALLLHNQIEKGLGAMGLFGPDARLFLFALTALYSVGLIANGFAYVLLGLHRFDVANYVAVSVLLTQSVGTIIVLKAGFGLPGLIILVTAISALSIAAYLLAAKMVLRQLRFGWGHFEFSATKKILGLGIQLQAYALVGVFYFYAGKVVVSLKFPLVAVAAFEVALRIPVLLRHGILFVLGPLMPAISHLGAQGNSLQVKAVMSKALRYSVILGIPAFVAVAVMAGPVIRLWVGSGFSDSILPLRIISLALGLSLFPDLIWFFLVGLGKQRLAIVFSLGEVLVGTAACYLLAGRWGLPGVAWGIFATSALGTLAFSLILVHKNILSRRDLPLGLGLKVAVVAGVDFAIVVVLVQHVGQTYLNLAIAAAIATAAYLLWLTKGGVLENSERDVLRKFIPRYLAFLC